MPDRWSASPSECLTRALATLEVLSSRAGLSLDRARGRRVLSNLAIDPKRDAREFPHRSALLPLLAEQLNVRMDAIQLTIDEAWEAVRTGLPLATIVHDDRAPHGGPGGTTAAGNAAAGTQEMGTKPIPTKEPGAEVASSRGEDSSAPDAADASPVSSGSALTSGASSSPSRLRDDTAALLRLDADWLVVERITGGRASVWRPDGESRLLGFDELRQLVGVNSPSQSVTWFSVQPATLSQAAPLSHAAAAQHEDGDHHSHHDHHPSPLERVRQLLRPDRGDIMMIGLFSLVVGVLGLATPIAVEALVNAVSFGRLVQPLVIICVMLLGMLGFAAVIKVLQAYVAELIQRRLFVRVVADLAYRLPRAVQSQFDREHPPELINRFFDVMTLQKSAALLVLDGLTMLLTTLIGMVVLAFYHPLLLGFDFFLIASFAFVVFALGRGAVTTAISESKAKYAVAAWLEELARVPTTMKGADGPRRALEHADVLASEYVNRRRAHFRILLRQIIFTVALQAIAGSLVLGLGGWLVLNGKLTLGQLVAAEMIVAVVVGSYAKLGKQMESFYDLLAAADKIGHLLDVPMERSTGELLPEGDGVAVTVKRVEVSLGGDELGSPTGDAFEFGIRPGEMVALLGRPGGGKSLLMDVLYGARDPAVGHALLDGIDIRALQPSELRRHVTLLREVEILAGSISENVHLHRDGVGGVSVRRALRLVGLLDELTELPRALETTIQPHGRPLSTSQCVRLMFARAIAAPPRLLLIDGLLDRLSDDALPVVIRAVRALLPQTTVIVVTGRDDVRQFCDRVVSVDSSPTTPDDQLKDWEPIDGRGLARDTA